MSIPRPVQEDAPRWRTRRTIAPSTEQFQAYSPLMVRWFRMYSQRYLRRHFHSLRISGEKSLGIASGASPVIYLNHASWWDPLVLLLLTQEFFPGRRFFAPMDAGALARYGFFRRIGCFGVELHSLRGAKQFLGSSLAVLKMRDGGLCMTPQGRFADVRDRPLRFEPGLGQLALRNPDALFIPLAVEYVFWEERLPEVLARFGQPVLGSEILASVQVNNQRNRKASIGGAVLHELEERLAQTQNTLAADSLSRDVTRFRNLLRGKAGVGGIYDRWRRLRSWMRGERFVPEHSSL